MQRADQLGAYTLPFQMNAARRAEDMSQFAVPYLQNQYRYNDANLGGQTYDAEVARRQEYGVRSGDWGRMMNLDAERYAPTENTPAQIHAVDSPRVKAVGDLTDLLAQEGLDISDPIAQDYVAQLEHVYGIPAGTLLQPGLISAEQQQYETTPAHQVYTDPVTGQSHAYMLDPRSYEQYGMYARALQMQQQQLAAQNSAIQQGWLNQKSGAAQGSSGAEESGPLGYFDGN
jgi:hypothetical protein